MAKRLQIIGDFPSDSTFDEAAVKQMVTDYLIENPPVAKVTINGMEPDETGNFNIEDITEGTTHTVVDF